MNQTKVVKPWPDDGYNPKPLIPERPLVPITLRESDVLPLPLSDSDDMEDKSCCTRSLSPRAK